MQSGSHWSSGLLEKAGFFDCTPVNHARLIKMSFKAEAGRDAPLFPPASDGRRGLVLSVFPPAVRAQCAREVGVRGLATEWLSQKGTRWERTQTRVLVLQLLVPKRTIKIFNNQDGVS